MLKFILIGCGAVSDILYKPAFHHLENNGIAKLITVVDTNLQRAKKYAADFGANAYDNLDDALKNEKLDAAVVATPHAFHAPITIQCLEAGLGVLCEKPLATTTADCELMITTAKRVQKSLAVGFFRRYFPSTKAIKLILENEVLGPVQSFDFLEGEKYSWPAKTTSFFSKELAGGGILIDAGSHLLDLLLWWLGEVKKVEYYDDSMGGVEANCELKLLMNNCVTGRIRLSREYPLENQYVIRCEKGDIIYKCDVANSIFIKDRQSGILQEYNLQKIQNFGDVVFPFKLDKSNFSFNECFFEQLENFCINLEDPANLSNKLDCAKKGIQIIETCYNNKKLIRMPWLSDRENAKAFQLSQSEQKTDFPNENDSGRKKIKIGVIGAGGFIGYRLCEWLILNDGAEVTPIIHSAKKYALLGRFNIKPEYGDLLDQKTLEQSFEGKDFIVHAAVGDEITIIKGIENTLYAAKKTGIKRVIYLSSICVYGNAPQKGTDETSPLIRNQKFSYNSSKVKAEEIILNLRKQLSIDVVILRPLIVWGPRSQYWVMDLLESMRQGTAYLVNQGNGICNCTYIDNVIEAIWLAIIKKEASNEDFIIMDNETVTWYDYYKALSDACNIIYNKWRYLSNNEVNEELEHLRSLEKKVVLKGFLFKTGSKILPRFIKRSISKSFSGLKKKSQSQTTQLISEEIVSLQYANYKLISQKAKKILGYKGEITFPVGMDATRNWVQFIRGRDF